MLEVVTPDLYPLYRDELRAMYRLRARVFHDRLGWQVVVRDGEERDEFDELGPIYLLALDGKRRVLGSSRLLPTTGPHMLPDVFDQLLDGGPAVRDPLVFEWSKFAIDNIGMSGGGLSAVKRQTHAFFCGIAEFCLMSRIRQVVTVYDARIARMLPRIGCRAVWQSRPQRIGKTTAYAASFEVTPGLLARMRAAGGLSGPTLHLLPESVSAKAA